MTKITGFAGGSFVQQTLQGSGGGGTDEGLLISTVGGLIPCKTPSGDVLLTFDWSDDIGESDGLASVVNTMPTDLTKSLEAVNAAGKRSTLQISGGTHAKLYTFTTVATLTSGQTITRVWPLRVFNG